MHIPRQADGPRAGRSDGALAGTSVVPAAGVDALRTRRRHLVHQLRAVVYWQRLVQARTDLLVAGLLYASPGPGPGGPSIPRVRPVGAPDDDRSDLHALGCPPDGMDLDRLLDGIAAPAGGGGAGEHLSRLRVTATLLAAQRGEVQDDLDLVTLALHEQLVADGAQETSLTW